MTAKRGGRSGGGPPAFGGEDNEGRRAIGWGINRLKRHRAVAWRLTSSPSGFQATVLVAAIGEWL